MATARRRPCSRYLVGRVIAHTNKAWHQTILVASAEAPRLHFGTDEVVALYTSISASLRCHNKA